MKKLSTFLLTVLMLIASANIFAYEFTNKGIRYETFTGYLRIIGVDASYAGNIEIVFGDITYTYNGTSYTKPCEAIASDVSFAGNSHITKVTCTLSSIRNIPQDCFQNCTKLTTVDLGSVNDVNFKILKNAFAYCTSLTSVTLPQEMWEIGEYAFAGCTSLYSMTFNNIYHGISPYAFQNCVNLRTITWNNEYVMYEYGTATPLTANSLTSAMPFYKSLAGIVTTAYVNTGTTTCIFYGMRELRNLTFGANVKTVGYNAFANCTALTTWSGGANIAHYNDKAFAGCTSLAKPIAMTASDTHNTYSIGEMAFYNTKVPSLVIGTTATEANYTIYLSENAFMLCSALKTIEFHGTMRETPSSVFSGCIGVTYLYWGCDDYYYDTDYSNYLNKGCFLSELTNLKTLEINRKDWIYEHEFYNLQKLEEVRIDERVKYVSKNAFYNCPALKYVRWQVPGDKNDYNNTSESPFAGSTLKSFVFGQNVTHIPSCLLAGQSQLTDVYVKGVNPVTVLPAGLKTIGAGAFYGVPFTSLTLPSGIESIGAQAFSGCRLTTITIPESLTSIGEQAFVTNSGPLTVTWKARRCAFNNSFKIDGWGVFYPGSGNQSISRITFGSGVEALPARLCFNAMQLTSVTLPESLQSIGDSAFNSCTNLIYIKSNAVAPPTLEGTHVFKGVNSHDPRGLEVVTLEVPANSLALYKSAEGWCEFYGTCGGDEAVEEVQRDKVQSTKELRNGTIIIRVGDKEYNLLGAQIR